MFKYVDIRACILFECSDEIQSVDELRCSWSNLECSRAVHNHSLASAVVKYCVLLVTTAVVQCCSIVKLVYLGNAVDTLRPTIFFNSACSLCVSKFPMESRGIPFPSKMFRHCTCTISYDYFNFGLRQIIFVLFLLALFCCRTLLYRGHF